MTGPGEYIIPADLNCYPGNVIVLLKTCLQGIDENLFVAGRQLRPSDPNEAVGVFPLQWNPDEDSYEMRGGLNGSEPTLQRYMIGVQAFVKDADEDRGLLRHAAFSRIVRTMLYRDPQLAVSLRALSVSLLGSVERTQRYGIRTARYLSNEIAGTWVYLSTLEFWIETETVNG